MNERRNASCTSAKSTDLRRNGRRRCPHNGGLTISARLPGASHVGFSEPSTVSATAAKECSGMPLTS